MCGCGEELTAGGKLTRHKCKQVGESSYLGNTGIQTDYGNIRIGVVVSRLAFYMGNPCSSPRSGVISRSNSYFKWRSRRAVSLKVTEASARTHIKQK